MCPTEALTSKFFPKYFFKVFAFAGDSTITRPRSALAFDAEAFFAFAFSKSVMLSNSNPLNRGSNYRIPFETCAHSRKQLGPQQFLSHVRKRAPPGSSPFG